MNLRCFSFCAVFAVSLLPSCVKGSGDEVENYIVVNDRIPSFTNLTDEDGVNTLSSSDLMGFSSIIFFFETGCKYCREELPEIEALWHLLGVDPEFKLVVVSRKDESLKKYWSENGLTMPVYIDKNRALFDQFANMSIPRTYVVNKQGVVTWMNIGSLPDDPVETLAAKIRANY